MRLAIQLISYDISYESLGILLNLRYYVEMTELHKYYKR